jgi:hypothetical protein
MVIRGGDKDNREKLKEGARDKAEIERQKKTYEIQNQNRNTVQKANEGGGGGATEAGRQPLLRLNISYFIKIEYNVE